MANKIVSIGFDIPGVDVEDINIKSKVSLLDYDVVIVDPVIYSFYGYGYDDYLGKPCLDDSNSFSLLEHLKHWKREILESIKAGKNVFLMLNSEQEVYVATGEKKYSGTGRNRQATRIVTPTSNYRIIPDGIDVTNSNGSSMSLVGKDNILSPYWSAVGDISEYRVLLSDDVIKPIVETKSGHKVVGGLVRYKGAEGNLILLPYIDFDREEYAYEKDGDDSTYWTDEAIALGNKFVSSICALDKALRSVSELSAIPDWVVQDKYVLPNEEKARTKLMGVELKIDELQKQKEQYEQDIVEESVLKRLLYENGKPLENAIRMALEVMGFAVSHYNNAESEFDVVFESNEGRLIGEAEGKDNKSINVTKLRQLEMNIHEDFDRDEVKDIAKGALIGNAYRLIEPHERGDFFTDKCMTAANRSGTALIRTTDLFGVAKYLSGKKDKVFAKKCREAIIKTTGVVVFPETPTLGKEIEAVIDKDDGA